MVRLQLLELVLLKRLALQKPEGLIVPHLVVIYRSKLCVLASNRIADPGSV